ncbi:MAG: hypothetical protein JNK53_05935 [Phycisphaerae bacterium]|nr:hypothetical protein [Phycisphaerae bacterium]
MIMQCTLRTLALAAAVACAGTAMADVFIDSPGPNNLDTIADGEIIAVGIDAGYVPTAGVFATNTVSKTFEYLYAWSDSVVTLNAATFTGFDLQAHDTSIIYYVGGENPDLSLVTYDDAAIHVSGGTIGFLGTGGGTGNGGTATITGGTIVQNASCAGGSLVISGGTFGVPSYGLPFSFISLVPAGITFQGLGGDIVATFVELGTEDVYGFGGNIWQLSGTLANGGSLDGLFMIDVGIDDPTVIVNYAGVRIAGADQPPVADAGTSFSVNEGDFVMLDGSASSDPDGDALTYDWIQIAGPGVALSGANTATPSFTAPTVAYGGETVSFQLTVTANGVSASAAVNVTVVNVNHEPFAVAGTNQTVAEGVLVTLDGTASYDPDGDAITYSWVQVGGTPLVGLMNATTATPSFVSPWVSSGGAALVFELYVDDGYETPGPATGSNAATVTITITHANNCPTANAGPCDTVNELTTATLNGTGSFDPDNDTLTYSWVQVSGPSVTLNGANTASPTFQAPSVNACGTVCLKFRLTVDDGYGCSMSDDVVIKVRNVGQPPDISNARPSDGILWPPNHKLERITIKGISSQGPGGVNVTITSVTQDEPTNGLGDGDTAIDAFIKSNGSVLLRAERSGTGNGRVYRVYFTATNAAGSSTGMVKVGVPHSKHSTPIDSGGVWVSTQ